jgi:hypothetical protein
MAETFALSSDALLVKTGKGADEIRHRTNRLAGRLRSLLVLIDGSRRVADISLLARNLGAGEESLACLVAEGYAVPAEGAAARPAAEPLAAPAANAGSDDRLMRLRGAKAAMLRYVRVGTGLIDAPTLNERIDRVQGIEDIPACLECLCDYLDRAGQHDAAIGLRSVVFAALGTRLPRAAQA